MKIDPKIWNTLILCSAKKNDVREYLRGIYFDFKNSRLVSTDGHRIFIKNNVPFDVPNDSESLILITDNTFKASARITEIEINDDSFGSKPRIQINYLIKGEVVLSRYAEVNNRKFPDIDRVVPKEEKLKPTDVVGINPQYIADVSKSLKAVAMKLQTYGSDTFGIEFIPQNAYKDIQYVVMAMRV